MDNTNASLGQSTVSLMPLTDQAKQLADDLKKSAVEVAGSVASAAKQEAGEIGVAAQDILHDATDRVKTAVIEQKTAGADYLDTVAHAIHRAAGEFDADIPQAAKYIRRAGGQLSSVAKAVRHRDIREIVSEIEGAARRQPALYFGGAVVLGFAALRFLKSAPPQPSPQREDNDRTVQS